MDGCLCPLDSRNRVDKISVLRVSVVVMFKRFYLKKCDPIRSRLTACAVVGLYMFTLIVIPSWDTYGYFVESDSAYSGSSHEFEPPAPESTDLISELVRLSVPFFVVGVPFLLTIGVETNISFAVLPPSVANATILPPCRAPPVF